MLYYERSNGNQLSGRKTEQDIPYLEEATMNALPLRPWLPLLAVPYALIATPAFAVPTIDVSSTTVPTAATAVVNLSISGLQAGTALGAFDLNVLFDPSIVGFSSASYGDPILGDQLNLEGFGTVTSTTPGVGTVDLLEISLDSASVLKSSQASNFILATLDFDALAAGTSSLTISINSLGDQNGNPLAADLGSGSITVSNPAPAPVIGHGLFVLLAVGGVLFGGKVLEGLRTGGVGNSVPEPPTLSLWIAGLLAIGLLRLRTTLGRVRGFSPLAIGVGVAALSSLLTTRPVLGGEAIYELQLVAPASSVSGILPDISINTTGVTAFTGTASDGFSKLFASDQCPVPGPLQADSPQPGACPTPTVLSSFFGSNRLFSGAAINNASPPLVLSEDRASGAPPVFFLRTYTDTNPSVVNILGASPVTFGFATSFFGLAQDGTVAAEVGDSTTLNPALQVYQNGLLAAQLDFSAGAQLRPQISKYSDTIVVTNNLLDSVFTYDTTLKNQTLVAGPGKGYSKIGIAPGISDDGSVVAFAATTGGISGINVAVSVPRGAPAVGNQVDIEPVVQVGSDGVTDLSASQTNRTPVVSQIGASFNSLTRTNEHYQLITVALSGTVAIGNSPAQPGVYTRDLLIRVFFPQNPYTGNPDISVAALSTISKIAATGDSVDGQALSSNFGLWDSAAILTTANNPPTPNQDEKSSLFAFTASSLTPIAQTLAVRARRVCTIPAAIPYNYKQFTPTINTSGACVGPWCSVLLSGGKATIGAAGCQLTSAANVTNFYTSAAQIVDPPTANQILANAGFIKTATGVCFPATQSCPAGPPQHLGFNGMPGGNVNIEGQIGLQELFGGPATGGLRVDVATPFDAKPPMPHPPVSVFPVIGNVNNNALQPVVDFFSCNQEPIVIPVPNCNTTKGICSQHFVLARGKDIPNQNATEDINDPGAAGTAIPPAPMGLNDIYATVGPRTRNNTIIGVRAITSASLPGARAGQGGFSVQVDSPVSLVITDPAGRRFGYDPNASQQYAEIPNAEITDDGVSDPNTDIQVLSSQVYSIDGPADAYGNVVGQGDGVLDGQYTIQAIGTGSGPYTLFIQSQDSTGAITTRMIAGTTSLGQIDTIFATRSSTPSTPLTLSTLTEPVRIRGDVLLHGEVNIDDVQAITQRIGKPADGVGDPMDLDGDGNITALDARIDVLLCTKPGCAR